MDQDSCEGAVCSEIQAALHDGTCHRLFPNDVRQCVIDTAADAAMNRCGNSREKAMEQAQQSYEKCNTPITPYPQCDQQNETGAIFGCCDSLRDDRIC